MKKLLLVFFLIFLAFVTKAQTSNLSTEGFHFAAGANIGFTPPYTYDHDKLGLGLEVQPEYRFSKNFSLYAATGYINFFYKDYIEDSHYQIRNAGVISITAGPKFYATSNFYIGATAGIGFITKNGSINDAAKKSGFDFQPQVGYTKNKIQCNFAVNVLANDNVNFIAGILYNLK
ncbi:MAG: outer membrane beta-barrel protein [Parafilimonas sp.]|nr:outer membrane beta-barrel protein [Parafilimonas sp.]